MTCSCTRPVLHVLCATPAAAHASARPCTPPPSARAPTATLCARTMAALKWTWQLRSRRAASWPSPCTTSTMASTTSLSSRLRSRATRTTSRRCATRRAPLAPHRTPSVLVRPIRMARELARSRRLRHTWAHVLSIRTGSHLSRLPAPSPSSTRRVMAISTRASASSTMARGSQATRTCSLRVLQMSVPRRHRGRQRRRQRRRHHLRHRHLRRHHPRRHHPRRRQIHHLQGRRRV